MHEVEAVVDFVARKLVGDHWVDLDLAVHVSVGDLWNVRPNSCSGEGRATPTANCHQLKPAGGEFCASWCHSDDDASAPTFVRRIQRSAHNAHVASCVEGVVYTTAGKIDEMRHHIAVYL